MDLPDDVLRDVTRLNELFRAQRTLSDKLEAVAEMVQDVVPGCDAVSISLTVEDAAFTGASTSQLAIEADLVQYNAGEGPCLDSASERAVIRIDALAHDESYEHFAPGAVEAGVESSLSLPLVTGGRTVGSLSLYSRTPAAFSDDVPARVDDQVAYAARLIRRSRFYEASTDALARLMEVVRQAEQVEIAVGMFIFDQGLSPDEAWDRLRDLADSNETSIVEYARHLIEEHERNNPVSDD